MMSLCFIIREVEVYQLVDFVMTFCFYKHGGFCKHTGLMEDINVHQLSDICLPFEHQCRRRFHDDCL